MHPLIGFALPLAERASLDHLERRGLQGEEMRKNSRSSGVGKEQCF